MALGAVAAGAASRRLIPERTGAFGGAISICPLVPRRTDGTDLSGGSSWAALAAISAHSNAAATAPSNIQRKPKLSSGGSIRLRCVLSLCHATECCRILGGGDAPNRNSQRTWNDC